MSRGTRRTTSRHEQRPQSASSGGRAPPAWDLRPSAGSVSTPELRHVRALRHHVVTPVSGDHGAAAVPSCHDSRVEELEDGWHSGGQVLWKDFECDGDHYSIAGGPKGVFLWSQGSDAGVDIPSTVINFLWSMFAEAASRTNVVKVRRRRWGPIRTQVLRREFPLSKNLLECVRSVEQEVREAAAHS
jgi:hypothetical protein